MPFLFSLRLLFISDSIVLHCLRYETYEPNEFELPRPFSPEEILSRGDMFRIKHCHHLSISCSKQENITFFVSLLGMACQVSGAVVAAVSAMTVELGRRLAPVIVEKGGKVSFSKGFLQVVCSVLFLDSDPPYFQSVPSFGFIKRL